MLRVEVNPAYTALGLMARGAMTTTLIHSTLVRRLGVEPNSSGWKPEALATKTNAAFGADGESRTRFFGVALRGTASNTTPALKW
jgi:hypothetical protein